MTIDIVTGTFLVVAVPLAVLSYLFRNKPGSIFGPIVCSKCRVELRGWNSSGRKQVWFRKDRYGNRVYFCAKCKNK
jgi:hypothetical protein